MSIKETGASLPEGETSVLAKVIDASSRTRPGEMVELERPKADDESVSFVDGLRDSLFAQVDKSARQVNARSLAAALGRAVRRPSPRAASFFYEQLRGVQAIDVVDAFLERVVLPFNDQRSNAASLARRIARGSSELEPVKIAIALLGIASDGRADDEELLHTLGRYEELTLFAVVALQRCAAVPEAAIWRLARDVVGWGRIHAVERLRGTTDKAVRAWLLREGFKNAIMNEYLALRCARAGDLLGALQRGEADDPLIDGAGAILLALCDGGPAEDMTDYPEGAEVARRYLSLVRRGPASDLERFLCALRLRQYASDEPPPEPWRGVACRWSSEERFEVRVLAGEILGRPEWKELAARQLSADDTRQFRRAAQVSEALGVDAWPARLERQERGHDELYFLMQTESAERVDRILDLARRQIDLELVATGPGVSLGLGPDYADDQMLDWVLGGLERFPNRGWEFVRAALRGRVVRSRNMALRVLSAWGKQNWSAEAIAELADAHLREPDADVRKRMGAVLSGADYDDTL
jgi:hypothetical protein